MKNVWGKGHVVLPGHVPGVACGCEQIRGDVMWPASTSTSDGGGMTGIGGGIAGRIGGYLGPVVCTLSARIGVRLVLLTLR